MKSKLGLFCFISLLGISQVTFAENDNDLLTGTWSSACASDHSGNFNREIFNFKGDEATYSIKTYSDSSCKTLISTLKTDRTYQLGDVISGLDNQKLDYTFKSVTMTYHNAAILASANKAPGYYGFSDWKLNQSKVISGLKKTPSSDAEHAQGEKFFTIVKIDGNKIYMGDYDSGAGTSDQTRLSRIYTVPFIKE